MSYIVFLLSKFCTKKILELFNYTLFIEGMRWKRARLGARLNEVGISLWHAFKALTQINKSLNFEMNTKQPDKHEK